MTFPMRAVNGTSSGQPALAASGLVKRFGAGDAAPVLDDFSLEVSSGEVVAIVGPSGCGKTTFLRIVQGLEDFTAGSLRFAEQSAARGRMSYVFQRPTLLPWETVQQNVEFGVSLAAGRGIHPSPAKRAAEVRQLIDMIGLGDYVRFYPAQISGGMQQRVNVARALAVRPDLLLLDEPFSALDALTRERLQSDMSRILADLCTTSILVTHDIREAMFMADRVVVMSTRPGRIAATYEVPYERPRTEEFLRSEAMAALERTIWGALRDVIHKGGNA
jgi:NitT/TauT family transport system ATP-binding protein